MKRNLTNSLIVKLSVMVILIESLVLAAIGYYYHQQFRAEIERQIEARLRLPGILMNRQLLRYESIADQAMIAQLVGEELVDGMVISADHQVFYALHEADEGQSVNTIPDFDLRWIEPAPTTPVTFHRQTRDHTFLVNITPLTAYAGSEPFFFVYLKVNSSRSEAQKARMTWLFVLGSGLCVLLTSAGLILGLNTIVTEPLSQLEGNARQIAQGNLHQTITIHRPDELGRLAQCFRQMRDAIRRHIAELRELNRTLEEKVEARTQELQENLMLLEQEISDRRQAEEQLNAALQEKEVLLREIHHRVKNNLAVVTSLIEMQADRTTDPDALALFRDLHNRVLAMTMVHEDLYQSELLSQIEFGTYLQRLALNIRQGFSKTPAAIKVVADDIFLDVQQAIPCGLIVAELVTNAFKYAFRPGPPAPEIRVEMRYDDPTYTLTVSDNGTGLPPDFDIRTARTLGMTLVRSWARHQLRGKIKVDKQSGTTFIIVFQDKQNNPKL